MGRGIERDVRVVGVLVDVHIIVAVSRPSVVPDSKCYQKENGDKGQDTENNSRNCSAGQAPRSSTGVLGGSGNDAR